MVDDQGFVYKRSNDDGALALTENCHFKKMDDKNKMLKETLRTSMKIHFIKFLERRRSERQAILKEAAKVILQLDLFPESGDGHLRRFFASMIRIFVECATSVGYLHCRWM